MSEQRPMRNRQQMSDQLLAVINSHPETRTVSDARKNELIQKLIQDLQTPKAEGPPAATPPTP